jgi:hypothetical protein
MYGLWARVQIIKKQPWSNFKFQNIGANYYVRGMSIEEESCKH